MDELGGRDGEGIAGQPRARGAIVEAHAERQQHVGGARRMVRLIGAVARDQSQRERVLCIDRAGAARRPGHRNAQPLRQPQEIGSGAAVFDALAHEDHRPLRGHQHVHRLGHAFRIGTGAAGDVGVPLLGLRRLLRGGLLEDVEGHVEHDGTGPPGDHRFPGLADGERHHVAARRLEHALAAGAHGRRIVGLIVAIELLEGAAVELAGGHVAGHGQERHRVEIGIGERDRQVCRAGPAGGEGRRRLAADPVVDVGHEARDGLVVHGDRLDIVRALIERVDEADIAVAAQAEDVRHLLPHKVVDDHLTAVEHVLGHS